MSAPNSTCSLDTCPLSEAYINYDPNLAANTLYLTMFTAFLLIQVYQGYYFKTWTYTISMILGLTGEVLGYVARVQMHTNPFLANPFLMYLSCITIAPVFFAAAIYLCLSRIVIIYGTESSRFRPKTYTVIFMTCDFISLVLQAVGGAIADTNLTNLPVQESGVHIMVTGLAFQVFSLLLFVLICSEYAWRVSKQKESRNTDYAHLAESHFFNFFLYALAFATLCIITRSCFRLAELQGGFSSSLANNEVLLMVFDGSMMAMTGMVLTVFHAGQAFKGKWTNLSSDFKSPKGLNSIHDLELRTA